MAAPTNAEDYMNVVGLMLSDIMNPWHGNAWSRNACKNIGK
jgi:hypothetical protein